MDDNQKPSDNGAWLEALLEAEEKYPPQAVPREYAARLAGKHPTNETDGHSSDKAQKDNDQK